MATKPFHEAIAESLWSNARDLISSVNNNQMLASQSRIIEVTSLAETVGIVDGYRAKTRQVFLNYAEDLWNKYPISAQRIVTATESFGEDSVAQKPVDESETCRGDNCRMIHH